MGAYLLKRLALMIPTLLGIMMISFIIIQFAPGGPVEQMIAKVSGSDAVTAQDIAAHAGLIRNSSSSWKSSLALISRPTSASSR
jgi:microcin C transport system permease protein